MILHFYIAVCGAFVVGMTTALTGHNDATARWVALASFGVYLCFAYLRHRSRPRSRMTKEDRVGQAVYWALVGTALIAYEKGYKLAVLATWLVVVCLLCSFFIPWARIKRRLELRQLRYRGETGGNRNRKL